MITRTFKLCLNAGTGSAPFINVSQYDEGETWLFELYSETGERYIPTTGAIVGVKSDGHGIANTGTVDSEGRVVIAETQQMTASAGRAIYELSIDGLTHGTANFIVAVERKPTDDAVMSDSDLSLIQEAIDSAEVIVEVIGDSDPSEVIGEHVDAWLDNHPEATTTVLDGAITAPKINNSLWDKLLVSEEASGAVASFDDGADDVPVSSLKVNLEPIQTGSGDPSPSNIRPIIASNGKNLTSVNEYTPSTYWGANNLDMVDILNTLPVGTYTISNKYKILELPQNGMVQHGGFYITANVGGTQTAVTTFTTDTDNSPSVGKVYNESKTFTITDDVKGKINNCYSYCDQASTHTGTGRGLYKAYDIQIERGSSASAYQPYQGISVLRTGKNLLNYNALTPTAVSNGFVVNADGTIYDSSPTEDARSWNYASCNWQMTLPAGTYTFTIECTTPMSNTGALCNGYKADGTRLFATIGSLIFREGGEATRTLTFTEPTTFGIIVKCFGTVFRVQIETGETSTDWTPFIGTSYPYTLGQSVYGGSVDLATGVLTVTWGTIALDGSKTWQGTPSSGWYMNLYSLKKYKSNYVGAIYADKLVTGREQGEISGYYDLSNAYPTQNWLYYYNNTFTSTNEVKSYFQTNPTQIVYELATPTTIQLTPQEVKTLLGYNNISSSGTVDVIYHADTKLYVDKMTNVDNAIIAPTEEGFTATRNYTVNDLVIVNDTLYKVTANIATGSAITPNSNVTQTTLSALIKALS